MTHSLNPSIIRTQRRYTLVIKWEPVQQRRNDSQLILKKFKNLDENSVYGKSK
jgi:hypothetical protein